MLNKIYVNFVWISFICNWHSVAVAENDPDHTGMSSCLWHVNTSPAQKFQKYFNGLRMRTPIHVFYFKNAQNRYGISGWKSALYWWQKKKQNTFWHP